MYNYEDYALAVKKGASILDNRYPRWEQAIDTESLNMRLTTRCILGQLGEEHSRSYDQELQFLGIDSAIEFGFEIPARPGILDDRRAIKKLSRDWDILADLWKDQIEVRR